MQKPSINRIVLTIIMPIIVILILTVDYYGFLNIARNTEQSLWILNGFIFVVSILSVIPRVQDYVDEQKKFIQNMKAMGKKYRIETYEVTEQDTGQGVKIYTVKTSITINDKEHKISKTVPEKVGKLMKASKPALDLYYDPAGTDKLLYILDIENIILKA